YSFDLTHSISRAPRECNPNENRFHVKSNVMAGSGNAKFYPIEGTLEATWDGSLNYETNKKRGEKIEINPLNTSYDKLNNQLNNQYSFVKENFPYLHFKKPFVIKKIGKFISNEKKVVLQAYLESHAIMQRVSGENLAEVLEKNQLTTKERFDLSIK